MYKFKLLILMVVITIMSACSQSIPFDYTKEDLEKIEQESYSYFPVHLQEQNDKADVSVDRICEVDERTLTNNHYNHIFIVQLENEPLNVSLNETTNKVDMVGNFSSNDTCKTL